MYLFGPKRAVGPGRKETTSSKTLWVKMTHIQVIEHTEIRVAFPWKLHPCWLDFIMLKGNMLADRGEK